jgi:hemerythrin-like domain-containing protein
MYAEIESPTEILKEEHRVIERMLKILNVACEKPGKVNMFRWTFLRGQ